ncbi:ABC transporter permease [Paenibacillus arenilitoris]|uniref:ABC transporter permease n=1 Tax=Paenibacillus arenilitoris TaxID=2772299 RepID=A0A927H7U6_9BACL|nr:ABC transporter permease [Paenibacillus arenilitoris]MBD2872011.1 ABC transporter permease [Paenibacillus arenilitoris]
MGGELRLEAIWSRRARAFREEIVPYIRYMAQSGFTAFLSLIFISSSIGYVTLIRDLPSGFPIAAVGVAALAPVLCWSPLRTWLAPADTVFMMPREADMAGYLRRSVRHTAVFGALLAALVLLLYLPIYNQGPALASGWLLAILAAGLKAANTWGAWRERRMAWPGMRRGMRLLRWGLTALVLAAWLTREGWQAAVFTALIGLLFALVHRFPARHRFPWERLIQEEARTRNRYYAFFGLFIDVPTLPAAVAKRSYLAWLLRAVPNANRYTYVYLYTASFIRAEIGGIVIRLLLLACLVVYWLADAASLSGWGAAAAYGLFLAVLAVQAGGLRHVHRHSIWKHVYPLPDKRRIEQYLKVDRVVVTVCAIVAWLFAAIPLAMASIYAPSISAAAGAGVYIALRPSRMRRRLLLDEEEGE